MRASEEGLQQVIRCSRIETAMQGLSGASQTITMPYVGLDLEKWESLFYRDDSNNPFLRVSFHLKLAVSMLTALSRFHELNFLHCDIKLNNWCVIGHVPALANGIGENPIHLFGDMNLSNLTLIDLGFAMTDLPSGRKLIRKANGNFVAVNGEDYVAESYRTAVDLAGSTGDFSYLERVSWKADLFSLGELFEKLMDSYGSRLVTDTGEPHLQFLRNLPDRLRSYEGSPSWSVASLPHANLIGEIHGITPLSLNQAFGILVRPEDVTALNDALQTGERSLLTAPDPPTQGGAQSEMGKVGSGPHGRSHDVRAHPVHPTQQRRWLRSTVALTALLACLIVVWSLVGRRPPSPVVPSRDDPVFASCDALRVRAVSGKALSRQDYSFAIGPCSEFLQLKGAPPDLRFDALITRAVAFEKTDRWHEALEDLALAEAIRPKDPGVDLNRSLVLSRQGNVQQAFAALDAAIDKGWRDGPLIEKDADYDAITKSPLYQSIRIRLGSIK